MKADLIKLVLVMILLHSCSMPTSSEENVSWAVNYTVPLANITYQITDLFTQIASDSTFSIEDPDNDSLSLGDTLNVNYSSHDTTLYSFPLLNPNSFNKEISLSEFSLKDLPPLETTFSIPDDFLINNSTMTLLKETYISPHFENIQFETPDDSIFLTIKNLSESIINSEISLSLNNEHGTVLQLELPKLLNPGESEIIQIPIEDLELTDSTEFVLAMNIDSNDIFSVGEFLDIAVDFGGLDIIEAIVVDSFINYEFEYTTEIIVPSDSFIINFVDFSTLHIPLTLYNPFPLELHLQTNIPSVVDREYAQLHNIRTESDIPSEMDESFSKGKSTFEIGEHTNNLNLRFDNVRILPQQNDSHSIIPLHFKGKISTTGAMVSLKSLGNFSIKTEQNSIEFKEISGYYNRDSFFEGDVTSFTLPFQGDSKTFEDMRDIVKFVNNDLSVDINFLMRDSSTISKMNYWCIMEMYCGDTISSDTLQWSMENIKDETSNVYHFDFSSVVNSFPDSIKYRVNYEFPQNEPVHFRDSLFVNEVEQSSISIPVMFNMDLKTAFVWDVSDTIILDLGTQSIPLAFEDSWYEPLNEKSIQLDFDIFNQSNISGRMFALAVTEEDSEVLDSLTPKELTDQFVTQQFDSRFIQLLGADALTIPPRNSSSHNMAILSEDDLPKILYSDTVMLRMCVMLLPSEVDALIDTDFLGLNASISLSGEQSTDLFN